jgi:transposase
MCRSRPRWLEPTKSAVVTERILLKGSQQLVPMFDSTIHRLPARAAKAGLLTLHDWLAAHRVTQVAMEATGVYWKPVGAVLEDDFEVLLVNARQVKQVTLV